MPDGSRRWPRIGSFVFREIAPIKRYQAIQTSRFDVNLKLVVENPLSTEQELKLIALAKEKLGYPFNITITYVDEFPKSKFEDFICEL
jgi:phenylacetate-CoA ligase